MKLNYIIAIIHSMLGNSFVAFQKSRCSAKHCSISTFEASIDATVAEGNTKRSHS